MRLKTLYSMIMTHNRRLYIVDQSFLDSVEDNILGYACDRGNFGVVAESEQLSRTVAHEIGHSLGLDHTNFENNVMTPLKRSKRYDVPNDFEQEQIDSMLTNIEWETEQHKRYQDYSNKTTQVYID